MNEESLDRRLQSLLKQGRKIEAIKLCKDELKIEFDDARQYIDEMIQQIESDSEPVSNDTQAVPINIQTTNFEPLEKSIEDSDKDTPNEKLEIFNTQPAKSTTDSEKTKKNDNKISLKAKIISGLIFLVILKGCSYHHYSTGGDNSGSKLSKVLYWIADTVIPWPETPRPESEVVTSDNDESDNDETDDFESHSYSQAESIDDTDDLKDNDNSENEDAETEDTEDTNDTESSASSQYEVNGSKDSAPITIENAEETSFGIRVTLSNGKTFMHHLTCARCSLVGWSGAAIVFLQDNESSSRLIIEIIATNGGYHLTSSGNIDLCRECQFKAVTQKSVIIHDGFSNSNKLYNFRGNSIR